MKNIRHTPSAFVWKVALLSSMNISAYIYVSDRITSNTNTDDAFNSFLHFFGFQNTKFK